MSEPTPDQDRGRVLRTNTWVFDARAARVASWMPRRQRSVITSRGPRWPWFAAGFDVLLLSSAPAVQDALDTHTLLGSLLTLSGHSWLVQLLAGVSLLLLFVLAPMSNGFRYLGPGGRAALLLAGMLTLVAGAGLALGLLVLPGLLLTLILMKITRL